MPDDNLDSLLILGADAVPEELRAWVAAMTDDAALASLELLADGRRVIQAVPGVTPLLVARVRRVMAQYEDVLRRLT